MRRAVIVVLFLALLAASVMLFATPPTRALENEPTGHGGLNWGDPMDSDFEVQQTYQGCPECPLSDAVRPGEEPTFLGLTFATLYYSFTEQGLHAVTFQAPYSEADFARVAQVLTGAYGPPDFLSSEHLYWGTESSRSMIALDRLEGTMVLSLQRNMP